MKTLWLDCSTGVSGDMLLAALSHAGDCLDMLEEGLAGLGLDSFRLKPGEKTVSSILVRTLDVEQTREEPLRRLGDLLGILENADLPDGVRQGSVRTLTVLARAEATVHGKPLEEVHFHEIGAVDTVVDVVGTHLLLNHLAPDRIVASPVNLGSGFVTFSHGTFAVPAPACAELSKGMRVFSTELGMEAATPTGLALVKTTVGSQGPMPEGSVLAVGRGSGTRSCDDFPTMVRAFLLEDG